MVTFELATSGVLNSSVRDRLSRHQQEQDLIADIEYCAPEMFMYDAHGVAYYDESVCLLKTWFLFVHRSCTGVDWYSLGATLFFLSTGKVFLTSGSKSFSDSESC